MIGRTEEIQPFALIRWVRHWGHREPEKRCDWCAAGDRPAELSRTALQIGLLLATYANKQGKAWPSVPRFGARGRAEGQSEGP